MITRRLGDLEKGQGGIIAAVLHPDAAVNQRFMEMGMLEGTRVDVIHEAPFGDPIAVRVRGALIAVRRAEARAIEVRT